MKLQHYVIIFVILILPFSVISRNNMKEYFLTLKDEVRLNNVIDNATQDALETLIDLNDEFQMMYADTRFDVNQTLAKEAVKSFFHTLAANFNMPYIDRNDELSLTKTETYFSMYVPAIIIVGYDGFFIYSVDESSTGGFAYQMSPKIPYSYVDDATGAIINFTLGNYIRIFTNNKFYEGEINDAFFESGDEKYQEFVDAFYVYSQKQAEDDAFENISDLTNDMSIIIAALHRYESNQGSKIVPSFLLGDGITPITQDYIRGDTREASEFHKTRREVIINTIKETLRQEINSHQTYAKIMGSNYDFSIPEIADEDWTNSINDISVMSFIQGMPIGTNMYYNNYALGGSRIVQTDYIYGTIDGDGKIYHKYDCEKVKGHDEVISDVFLNRVLAAEQGYWPCMKCRP